MQISVNNACLHMNTAGAHVCVCVCVRRASSENHRGHRGDGGNEEEREREREREIKEVTGEMVDGKEGAGRGQERRERGRGEEGAWRRDGESEEERALERKRVLIKFRLPLSSLHFERVVRVWEVAQLIDEEEKQLTGFLKSSLFGGNLHLLLLCGLKDTVSVPKVKITCKLTLDNETHLHINVFASPSADADQMLSRLALKYNLFPPPSCNQTDRGDNNLPQ